MGFDIEYGWQREYFVLKDVQIHNGFELQQPDEDGDWVEREPPIDMGVFSKTKEEKEKENSDYENFDVAFYSKSKRVLTAKAGISENNPRVEIYLGVPEEHKQRNRLKEDANRKPLRLEYFKIKLIEIENDDISEIIRYGHFGYIDYSDLEISKDSYPYAEFCVPTKMFDDIERLTNQIYYDIELAINRKGWSYIGDFGIHLIYLNNIETDKDMAEMAGITISRKFKELYSENMKDTDQYVYQAEGYSPNAIDTNLHLFHKLNDLRGYMTSIHFAAWIIALGVIYLVVNSYL